MFVRIKKSGTHKYLQVVVNRRIWGSVDQQVIGNMGRLDKYLENDNLREVITSLTKILIKFKHGHEPKKQLQQRP